MASPLYAKMLNTEVIFLFPFTDIGCRIFHNPDAVAVRTRALHFTSRIQSAKTNLLCRSLVQGVQASLFYIQMALFVSSFRAWTPGKAVQYIYAGRNFEASLTLAGGFDCSKTLSLRKFLGYESAMTAAFCNSPRPPLWETG